ncbi:Transthyretin-like family protein [Onchocerca flexuosa]|uniref:Transthyretin-like family protein n=1 Tax=Onchocerca flexuosa TaxID=387005 RepID=A0A238BV77_9BILA|nr:Transthyretin-like family protein [Onchocerca flexuosa]
MKWIPLFVLWWLLSNSANALFALSRVQSVAVQGILLCEGRPLPDHQIILIDHDKLDPDDIMATNITDQRGYFFVRGNESEWSTIDPMLIVRHKCNDGGIPCDREWRLGIPLKYISNEGDVQEIMNMGILNAEVVFHGEKRDCLLFFIPETSSSEDRHTQANRGSGYQKQRQKRYVSIDRLHKIDSCSNQQRFSFDHSHPTDAVQVTFALMHASISCASDYLTVQPLELS